MRTLEEYLALVPPLHQNKPKFLGELSLLLAPLADLQVATAAIPQDFDVDVAIGVQLDITAQWVGTNRHIPEPLPNLWFSFDTLHKGCDESYWKGPYDVGTLFERLDDDTFRRLVYAKILANNWDGTIASAQAILDEFFNDPATYIMVEDNAGVALPQKWFSFDDPARGMDGSAVWYIAGSIVASLPELDMSVTIGVAGKIPRIVDLEILAKGLIPIHTGGVEQDIQVTSVNGAPLFGFDVSNRYVAGFEEGGLGVSPQYMIDQL